MFDDKYKTRAKHDSGDTREPETLNDNLGCSEVLRAWLQMSSIYSSIVLESLRETSISSSELSEAVRHLSALSRTVTSLLPKNI